MWKGLMQVVVGAFAQALANRREVLHAGDHHHLDRVVEGLDGAQELDAARPRHVDVGEDEGEPPSLDANELERFLRVGGGLGREADARDLADDEPPDGRLVVDHEHEWSVDHCRGSICRWHCQRLGGRLPPRCGRRPLESRSPGLEDVTGGPSYPMPS